MIVELSPSLPVADRRARRSAETRGRLLSAARQLFVELGYHATRPQDIARVADVATGTFYTHFTDKRAVFLAFVAQAGEELTERISKRSVPGEFKGRLTMSLYALLEYDDENPGVLGAAFTDPAMIDRESQPIQGMREGLAQNLSLGLERGIQAGELRSDFDPNLIAHAIVGFIHQALVYGATASVDRENLVDQVTRFCDLALVPTRKTAGPCNARQLQNSTTDTSDSREDPS